MSTMRRAVVPDLAAAVAPTAELRRHHDILQAAVNREVRRMAARIETRLEKLVKIGADKSQGEHITQSEYYSALRWLGDYEAAQGVRDQGGYLGMRVDCAKSSDGISGRMIEGAARIRDVALAIGEVSSALLRHCIAYDKPWSETARRLALSDHTVKEWTCDAIRELAEYYDVADGCEQQGSARIRAASFA